MNFLYNLPLAMLCIQAIVGGTKSQECGWDERCLGEGGICFEPGTEPKGWVPITDDGRPLLCDGRTGCVCFAEHPVALGEFCFGRCGSCSDCCGACIFGRCVGVCVSDDEEMKNCLEEKTVMGNKYNLVGGKSDNEDCHDDCLYSVDGNPKSRFCFAEHALASGGCTVFQQLNYGAPSYPLAPATSISNLTQIGWNDVISSVKVTSGCTLTAAIHDDFKGQHTIFSMNTPFLPSSFDNTINSIRCNCN